jgi:predicted Fe-Mo cluster-binding NifX family protein
MGSSHALRIAFVTDDGETISSHFGQAASYRVFRVEGDRTVDLGLRPKAHHGQGHHQPGLHGAMLDPISDCQVLVSGGMGEPAWEKARRAGLEIYLAGGTIADAVAALLRGELRSDELRLHQHRH